LWKIRYTISRDLAYERPIWPKNAGAAILAQNLQEYKRIQSDEVGMKTES